MSREASEKLSRQLWPRAEAVYPERPGRQLSFEFHLLLLRLVSRRSRSTNASLNSGEPYFPEDPEDGSAGVTEIYEIYGIYVDSRITCLE